MPVLDVNPRSSPAPLVLASAGVPMMLSMVAGMIMITHTLLADVPDVSWSRTLYAAFFLGFALLLVTTATHFAEVRANASSPGRFLLDPWLAKGLFFALAGVVLALGLMLMVLASGSQDWRDPPARCEEYSTNSSYYDSASSSYVYYIEETEATPDCNVESLEAALLLLVVAIVPCGFVIDRYFRALFAAGGPVAVAADETLVTAATRADLARLALAAALLSVCGVLLCWADHLRGWWADNIQVSFGGTAVVLALTLLALGAALKGVVARQFWRRVAMAQAVLGTLLLTFLGGSLAYTLRRQAICTEIGYGGCTEPQQVPGLALGLVGALLVASDGFYFTLKRSSGFLRLGQEDVSSAQELVASP